MKFQSKQQQQETKWILQYNWFTQVMHLQISQKSKNKIAQNTLYTNNEIIWKQASTHRNETKNKKNTEI